MNALPISREASIVGSTVSNSAYGSEFTLTFDVSDGPIRDLLFEIVKNRKYVIELADHGRAMVIRDLSDLSEPVTFSNGVSWIPREAIRFGQNVPTGSSNTEDTEGEVLE